VHESRVAHAKESVQNVKSDNRSEDNGNQSHSE